jgi:hypothetical protein
MPTKISNWAQPFGTFSGLMPGAVTTAVVLTPPAGHVWAAAMLASTATMIAFITSILSLIEWVTGSTDVQKMELDTVDVGAYFQS